MTKIGLFFFSVLYYIYITLHCDVSLTICAAVLPKAVQAASLSTKIIFQSRSI